MRRIINEPVENNIININDLIFNENKIYIVCFDNTILKLNCTNYDNKYYVLHDLSSSISDYWTGNGLGIKSPKETLKAYAQYELYEFDNIIEFSKWLYERVYIHED